MLQQTQVSTVIPFFEKFMQRFPTVTALAEAPLDDVLSHWAGLGYYARARHLHRTAKMISHEYQGAFPQDVDLLQTLPGIGRSTAGAIAAFSWQLYAPILDGNVKRVLSRLHAVEGWPGNNKTLQTLWQLAEAYTPHKDIAAYTQAMMDIGATLCTRTKPQCHACPVQSACAAFAQGTMSDYPAKKPSQKKPIRNITMMLLRNQHGQILLHKRPPVGIWGGLWSFPEENDLSDVSKVDTCIASLTAGCATSSLQTLPTLTHVFTHFTLYITPLLIDVSLAQTTRVNDQEEYAWHDIASVEHLGIPAPVRKLLEFIPNVSYKTRDTAQAIVDSLV